MRISTVSRLGALTAMAVAALAVALACPAAALAWGNGPAGGRGFGTHDWVLAEANRIAASQGATWLDASLAQSFTDDPDTVLRDFNAHSYNRWGKRRGTADARVAALYKQAVTYLKAGDIGNASRVTGLLSHYYADVCEPLNTADSKAENRMHGAYDRAVDSRLTFQGRNAGWVAYDGYQHVSNAARLTSSSASSAHRSYSTLVTQYNRKRYNRSVDKITRSSINRATNGMADIIMSIQEDAAQGAVSPDVMAHQGVATDGANYYIFHTTWIEKYDSNWYFIDTTSTPFAQLEGYYQPHLGSGCYYDGKLYVPAENYPAVTNQHILVFDANTLDRVASVATSQTHEVAATTVVAEEGEHGTLYVASFYDSSQLFRYDLETLKYVDSLPLSPSPPSGFQGLSFHDNRFYLAVGRSGSRGSIYTAERTGASRLVYFSSLPGIHEGIDFLGEQLIWLIDNGPGDQKVHYFNLPVR